MIKKNYKLLLNNTDILKLGILSMLIYLSVDSLFPKSSNFLIRLGKAFLISFLVLIFGYLLIK